MSLKKFMSILCMLTISLLVFTACEETEEPPIDPPGTTITVSPVGTVFAGQTDENTIAIMWDASASEDSSWFEGYEVSVSGQEATVTTKNDWYEFTGLNVNASTPYTFTVRALGKNADTIVKSTTKSIQWALASHFDKNDVGGTIKVYVKESSNYGSGLNLFDETAGAPSNWKVANGAKWNLALGSKSELIFGTASSVASKMSYNLTGTPVDAEIAIPTFDNDSDVLTDLLEADLSKFTYSKQYFDLNSSAATSNSEGFLFFAKINNHYARIVVLKKGGKYLQDETSSDPYIQLLVSYQKRAGVPFAKISK